MNFRKTLIALATAALCIPAGISAQDDPPVGSTVQWESLQGNAAEFFDVVTPSVGGRNFAIVDGSVQFGFSLGCSGFGDFELLGQMQEQIRRMWDYVKNNASGLAVNYLIYSQPTLHAIYQNLQVKRDMYLDQVMLTCSSVREWASNSREEKWRARGIDECIKQTGDTAACNDGQNLGQYVQQARDKWFLTRELSGVTGRTLKEVIAEALNLPTTAPDPLDQPAPENEQEASEQAKERLASGFTDFVHDETLDRDGSQIRPRAKSLDDHVRKAATSYGKWVATASAVDAGRRASTSALKKLDTNTATKRISPQTLGRLGAMRRNNPNEFEGAVEVLSREMALADGKELIAQMKAGVINATITGEYNDWFEEGQLEDVMRSIELLEAELEVLQVRLDNADRQSYVERRLFYTE